MLAEVALPLPLDQTFTYKIPKELESRLEVGHAVLVPFRSRHLPGIVTEIQQNGSEGKNGSIKDVRSLLNAGAKVSPIHLELTRWIAQNYGCGWGEALSAVLSSLKKTRRPLKPFIPQTYQEESKAGIRMTEEQSAAAQAVREAVSKRESRPFLLFGVTSSGKTEVYLNAVQEALEKEGRSALFIVPEISLCRPFYEILTARMKARIGIWHSQMPASERFATVEGIRRGSIRIVLGARSALFAPLSDVGVVILDEEHDFSYKQEEKPRYHAREAAIKLAELHKAAVILGSATPSLESFYKARSGEFRLFKLTQRVPGHTVPEITLVDRKRAVAPEGKSRRRLSPLTPSLNDAIRTALARREQVILALNRRGYSTYFLCVDCGQVAQCPNCQITLIHHQGEGPEEEEEEKLRCHFCFFSTAVPSRCRACGSSRVVLGGFGTQKIVQEVKKEFPFARVHRLDRDVTRRKAAASLAYEAFRAEEADIWVGTQMVTQGFDFPRVTLVGIVDADTALHHPDFRSSERTFQWITQASGRAGRSPMGGRVVIQTAMPEHPALELAARQNFEDFYENEMTLRKSLLYPPFSRLVLLRIQSSSKREWVAPQAESLAKILRETPELSTAVILGPGPSSREHLQKQLRWQILVKCLSPEDLPAVLKAARSFEPRTGLRFIVDVDPYDVL